MHHHSPTSLLTHNNNNNSISKSHKMAALVNHPSSAHSSTSSSAASGGGGSGQFSTGTNRKSTLKARLPVAVPPNDAEDSSSDSCPAAATFPGPSRVSAGSVRAAASAGSSNEPIVATDAHLTTDETAQFEADKRLIYKHPLFPLLALLFEKCEMATQSTECPSTESFNLDIQAFVQHQDREGKPFFTDNHEVNDLMIKSIQVLRIHLLELEKVQELCKDFCNRYITCLKGKMQSENLLRSDYGGYDSDDSSGRASVGGVMPTSAHHSLPAPGMIHPHHPALMGASASSPAGPYFHHPAMHHNAISTAGIVLNSQHQQHYEHQSYVHGQLDQQQQQQLQYQQQQQNWMYHYYQYQQQQHQQQLQQQQQQQQHQMTMIDIDGSTPLSAIGANLFSNQQLCSDKVTSASPLSLESPSPEDDFLHKNQKRGVLPKQATNVMRTWLFQHIVHPYPTEDEKRDIARQTNLSLLQVNNWFINARRRILQPMLDASSPDHQQLPPPTGGPGGAVKRRARAVNGKPPAQRFWPEYLQNLQVNHASFLDSDESDIGAPLDGDDESNASIKEEYEDDEDEDEEEMRERMQRRHHSLTAI